jgi:hypothetical protein
VLFSNDQVVRMIHESFEPVWESVRPVPILTLDFGNGHTITRTLHGNVVTSVCTADGKTLDALPGLYETKTFLEQLDQLWLLHGWLEKKPAAERESAWCDYHRTQSQALMKNLPPGQFISMDPSKIRIERSAKRLMINFVPPQTEKVIPKKKEESKAKADRGKGVVELPTKALLTESGSMGGGIRPERDRDVSQWKELVQDTQLNETLRRLAIHVKFSSGTPSTPAGLTRWIYADVLHADLDDPYLGLGPFLKADYPFPDGNSAR